MKRSFIRTLTECSELKHFDRYIDVNPSLGDYVTCGGTMYHITGDIPQGGEDKQRVGNRLRVNSLEIVWRINWPFSEESQLAINYRLIVFIWHDNDHPFTEDIIEISSFASPPYLDITSYQAFYRFDNQVKYTILYDKVLTGYAITNAEGTLVTTDRPLVNDYKMLTGLDIDTQYEIVTPEPPPVWIPNNGIYALLINDVPNSDIGNTFGWFVNLKFRVTYIDV